MKENNEETDNKIKNTSKRKQNNTKNKTKKKHININKLPITISATNLSKEQRDIVCKNYFNKYDTFEDKIEELFKKNKIDFASTIDNLDKVLLLDFKKASTLTKITPQNDYYSYINNVWIKDYEVKSEQKYIVQVDDFRLVQDKVFRELTEIVKDYTTNKHTSLAKNMKNYYDSIIK